MPKISLELESETDETTSEYSADFDNLSEIDATSDHSIILEDDSLEILSAPSTPVQINHHNQTANFHTPEAIRIPFSMNIHLDAVIPSSNIFSMQNNGTETLLILGEDDSGSQRSSFSDHSY